MGFLWLLCYERITSLRCAQKSYKSYLSRLCLRFFIVLRNKLLPLWVSPCTILNRWIFCKCSENYIEKHYLICISFYNHAIKIFGAKGIQWYYFDTIFTSICKLSTCNNNQQIRFSQRYLLFFFDIFSNLLRIFVAFYWVFLWLVSKGVAEFGEKSGIWSMRKWLYYKHFRICVFLLKKVFACRRLRRRFWWNLLEKVMYTNHIFTLFLFLLTLSVSLHLWG